MALTTAVVRRAAPVAIGAGMLAIYLIWGSTFLGIRFALESLPPFLHAALRFLVAGALLFVTQRLRGDPPPTAVQWRSAAILGLCLMLGGNGTVVWSQQRVPSGLTALIVSAIPLWMVLFDWLRPGGRFPGRLPLIGVFTGFAGVVLLMGFRGVGAGAVDPVGALVLIGGTFFWASGSLYNRSAHMPSSPLLGTSMQMLCGGTALLLVSIVAGDWNRFQPAAVSLRSALALGYLIVFGSMIAFSTYVWLLRNAPTPLVATYAYVNPVIALTLGSLLAGEQVTPRTALAAAIILGSVVMSTVARARGPAASS